MISSDRVAKVLRSLGYEFKEQLHHQNRWRKAGGTHVIHVPRKSKQITEDWMRNVLRQASVKPQEIDKIIGELKA